MFIYFIKILHKALNLPLLTFFETAHRRGGMLPENTIKVDKNDHGCHEKSLFHIYKLITLSDGTNIGQGLHLIHKKQNVAVIYLSKLDSFIARVNKCYLVYNFS